MSWFGNTQCQIWQLSTKQLLIHSLRIRAFGSIWYASVLFSLLNLSLVWLKFWRLVQIIDDLNNRINLILELNLKAYMLLFVHAVFVYYLFMHLKRQFSGYAHSTSLSNICNVTARNAIFTFHPNRIWNVISELAVFILVKKKNPKLNWCEISIRRNNKTMRPKSIFGTEATLEL